ncbi:MAG: DUF1844 domain-containing protein [Verrucomicrobia bacterium]|jgi:hypothetical protein|nr:DUF1844 domain-containing protein [Verrucomicrobiota bacterium]
MSQPSLANSDLADPAQRQSALFAGLVLQHVNMALMFLGRMPGPEGKPVERDLDAASAFVDTLEMLEVKTQGNLTKDETEFLKQSLMSVRMAFAQAVQEPEAPAGTEGKPAEATAPANPAAAAPASAEQAAREEKVRFSKKY